MHIIISNIFLIVVFYPAKVIIIYEKTDNTAIVLLFIKSILVQYQGNKPYIAVKKLPKQTPIDAIEEAFAVMLKAVENNDKNSESEEL